MSPLSRLVPPVLALAATAAAQDPRFAELEPVPTEGEELTVEREGGDAGPVRGLVWHLGERVVPVPLARPVPRVQAGRTPDGRGLVLLAGGLRQSLSLYLVQRDGEVQVVPTREGRLLAPSFRGGKGSMPLVGGSELVLVAWQQAGAVEFRALDFAGRTLASAQLDGEVTGFEAVFSAEDHGVHVTFSGVEEELDFAHPLAPRLVAGRGILDFGRQPVGRRAHRELELRNEGVWPAHVRLRIEGQAFAAAGPVERRIEGGGSERIAVEFVAGEGTVGRLHVLSDAPEGEIVVLLRGGLTRPRPEEPEPDDEGGEPAVPEPPAAPRLEVLDVRVDPDGRRLAGRLLPGPEGRAPPVGLRLRCGGFEREVPVGIGGAVGIDLPPEALDDVLAVAVDARGRTSPEVVVWRSLPRLRWSGGRLEVHGVPGGTVRLAVIDRAAGGSPQVLWTRRVHLGPEGRASLGAEVLGPRRDPFGVVAVGVGGRAGAVSAPLVIPAGGG